MQALFINCVYLILIILALVMLANKLRLAYPIILVLGGLALSFLLGGIISPPDVVFMTATF